jgi:hypothetical protein
MWIIKTSRKKKAVEKRLVGVKFVSNNIAIKQAAVQVKDTRKELPNLSVLQILMLKM